MKKSIGKLSEARMVAHAYMRIFSFICSCSNTFSLSPDSTSTSELCRVSRAHAYRLSSSSNSAQRRNEGACPSKGRSMSLTRWEHGEEPAYFTIFAWSLQGVSVFLAVVSLIETFPSYYYAELAPTGPQMMERQHAAGGDDDGADLVESEDDQLNLDERIAAERDLLAELRTTPNERGTPPLRPRNSGVNGLEALRAGLDSLGPLPNGLQGTARRPSFPDGLNHHPKPR